MQFRWHPDEPPPQIEAHSKAKLEVLRNYIRAYFDTLNVNPSQEKFRLDLAQVYQAADYFATDE